ncbi:hypothetical protein [Chelatococcus reniformis]|uniref:Uncharacterized protein n=1 Tax=Chelatococcus reniformis TaxID=1494448 RepID=A0A916XPQ5_9HYPH|nr:hypothetical protein [Chelatococcus reniformis]GGC90223.1 hypothetical protein GCM10010994_55070 [Chelatococcus reniformis]
MGGVLTVDQASYLPNARAFRAPVEDGLLALGFPGGGADQTVRNLARGGLADGAIVGTPTFSPFWASFDGPNSALELPQVDLAVASYAVAARSTTANTSQSSQPIFMGTFNGSGAAAGSTLYVTSTTVIRGNAATTDGSTTQGHTIDVAATPGNWNFLGFDFDNAAQAIRNMTTGAKTSGNHAGGFNARVTNGKNIRVGAGYASFAGDCDVFFYALYNRRLSDNEWAALYSRIKAIAAGLSSPIAI